jgi:threonine dehydratase
MAKLSLHMINQAAKIFHGWFGMTPIQYCPLLSQKHLCPMIFKCDYFQPSGSTHLRSAFYFLSLLKDEEKKQGVAFIEQDMMSVAVAYAASLLNIPCMILLKNPPCAYLKKKLQQFHAYFVVAPQSAQQDITSWAQTLCCKNQRLLIPSLDDRFVAADGGSLGVELLKQIPQLKNVIVPMESGSIAEGLVFFLKRKFPDSVIIGVSPQGLQKTLDPSWKSLIDHHLEISQQSIDEAILWYLENYYTILSNQGALALAAALAPGFPKLHGPAAVILSSNCCDPKMAKKLLSSKL